VSGDKPRLPLTFSSAGEMCSYTPTVGLQCQLYELAKETTKTAT
jgi:hypothetical protein